MLVMVKGTLEIAVQVASLSPPMLAPASVPLDEDNDDDDDDDDDDAGTLSPTPFNEEDDGDVDPSIRKTWELLYINPNMRYLTLIALIIHFSSIHYTGAFFAKEVIM